MSAAALKFTYSAMQGEFDKAVKAFYRPISQAATAAIKEAAAFVKVRGRAQIAAAGFSAKWQNALRVTVYPRSGASADAAAWIYHKIPYAGVFERGATITGSPLLWLPIGNAPQRIGGKRFTARNYVALIGPLKTIRVPGKPPMLAGFVVGRPSATITVRRLKNGNARAALGGRVIAVPLFIGIDVVKIAARFNLSRIFNEAHTNLAGGYLRNLRVP